MSFLIGFGIGVVVGIIVAIVVIPLLFMARGDTE